MKTFFNAGCMAILLLAASCSNENTSDKANDVSTLNRKVPISANTNDENKSDTYKNTPSTSPIKDGIEMSADSVILKLENGGPNTFTDWDKKIIKTANVKMEVKNFEVFDRYIHTSLRNFGAYVGAEQQVRTQGNLENSITIKVPVGEFDNLLNQLPTKENILIEKTINSDDVTAEVVDTKSRIEAKSKVRERYMHLLEGAKTMDDILKVEAVVNDMQEEIESADGRVKHLVHESAYSTIHLWYTQTTGNVTPTNEQPGFGSKAWNAIKSVGSWLSNVFVALLGIWPLILGIVLVALWLRKKGWMKSAVPTTQQASTNV